MCKNVNVIHNYVVDSEALMGRVVGVDLQHMNNVPGAVILKECDLTADSTQQKISSILGKTKVNVFLSDMAPNATGIKSMDHEIIMQLCYVALTFAVGTMARQATFVCKVWQGPEQRRFEAILEQYFEQVKIVKPKASRLDSAEIFLLAKNFTPPSQGK